MNDTLYGSQSDRAWLAWEKMSAIISWENIAFFTRSCLKDLTWFQFNTLTWSCENINERRILHQSIDQMQSRVLASCNAVIDSDLRSFWRYWKKIGGLLSVSTFDTIELLCRSRTVTSPLKLLQRTCIIQKAENIRMKNWKEEAWDYDLYGISAG